MKSAAYSRKSHLSSTPSYSFRFLMTTSVACIVQARCNSSRFPSKVLSELGGKSLLSFLLDRVLRSRCINEVIVATTVDISDDPIERIALSRGVKCIRGSEKDVLGRYCSALNYTNADVLVRITGDCPLIDPSGLILL